MDARVVAWRGVGVRVQADPAALDLLEQHLPGFYGGPARVVAQARLSGTDQLVVELPDGLSVSGPFDPETFRAAASRIELLVAAALPDRVAVHAGVVAFAGRAVVVPGPSHSGKSTLVQALVEAGATYLSDEFALLDEAGRVWPYPRQLTLRTETGTTRHLPERSAAVTDDGLEVALVANLAWSTGGWQVEAATRGQAMLALAANALPVRAAPARTLDTLVATVATAAGLRGRRGEADAAATELLALL